jgi:transmembrane sensor
MRVVRDTSNAAVTLHAGDRGRLSAGGTPTAERGVVTEAPAWTGGRLVFENASMAEVRDGLHRWYGIDLQVHDTALAGRHVTATFASEPADQVLRIIALALGGTIERRGNTAILHTTPSTSVR